MATIKFEPVIPTGGQVQSAQHTQNYQSLSLSNELRAREYEAPASPKSVYVEPASLLINDSQYKIYSGAQSPDVPSVVGLGQYQNFLLALDPITTNLSWNPGTTSGSPNPPQPTIPDGLIPICVVKRFSGSNAAPIVQSDIIDVRSVNRVNTAIPPSVISTLTSGPTSDASSLHNHDGRYYTKTEINTKLVSYKTLLPHWRCKVYAPDPSMPALSGNSPAPSNFSSDQLFPSPNNELLIPTIDGSITGVDSILKMSTSRSIALVFSMRVNVTGSTNVLFSFLNDKCRSNIYISPVGGGVTLPLGDRSNYFPENALTTTPLNSFSVNRDYSLSLSSAGIRDIEIVVYTLPGGITSPLTSWSFFCVNKILLDSNITWIPV